MHRLLQVSIQFIKYFHFCQVLFPPEVQDMTVAAVNKANRGISLPAGARKLLDSNDKLQSACHFHAVRIALHIRDLSTHITCACVLHMQIQVGLTFTFKHRIFSATSNSVHNVVPVGCTALLLRHPRTLPADRACLQRTD